MNSSASLYRYHSNHLLRRTSHFCYALPQFFSYPNSLLASIIHISDKTHLLSKLPQKPRFQIPSFTSNSFPCICSVNHLFLPSVHISIKQPWQCPISLLRPAVTINQLRWQRERTTCIPKPLGLGYKNDRRIKDHGHISYMLQSRTHNRLLQCINWHPINRRTAIKTSRASW